ncbi:hypothetical protein GGQ86_000916 [Xanthobacter flavus]|uniref:Uncharacterized protein n=1 Tax=Xanthobacter flavus TaxID=281 RepID=A0ABU1KCB2_XANFL|nr:hypothetical protein [Xanthobacter flavus]MDR6332469.1 hypothetical protein [Xanthobacter flavus]
MQPGVLPAAERRRRQGTIAASRGGGTHRLQGARLIEERAGSETTHAHSVGASHSGGRKQAVVPHQTAPSQRSIAMLNRNILYLAIGVLLIVVGVVGYQLYKERQKPSGIEINFGKSGISIEEK